MVDIENLFTAIDKYSGILGEEEGMALLSLAWVRTGAFFWHDPERFNPSAEEMEELIVSVGVLDKTKDTIRRRIQYLMDMEHLTENMVCCGLISDLISELEKMSEDLSATAAKNRKHFEENRIRMQDPVERERSAKNINAMIFPEMPRIKPEDLAALDERMAERYGAPANLLALKEARERYDTWKSIGMKLLSDL